MSHSVIDDSDPLNPSHSAFSSPPVSKTPIPARNDDSPPKKHVMTSTWHKDEANRSWRNPVHFTAWRTMYQGPQAGVVQSGKIGVYGVWEQNMYLIPRVLPPLVAQYISMKYFDYTWHPVLAYAIYGTYCFLISTAFPTNINRLADIHGFLDGGVPRDNVPDEKVGSTVFFLFATLLVRPALVCFAAYDRTELPRLSPYLPLHMFAYILVLDFWFYWYHRAMHEVDWLWRYHRTHHLTKHPSPILSAFADVEQDICDILVIPLLTYLTLRPDFFTWWICTIYVLFVESAGHSGLRVQWLAPFPGVHAVLSRLGMELCVEDHDLHHRMGWKKSFNYGKQTRVWDTLFGTRGKRIEMVPDNLEPI